LPRSTDQSQLRRQKKTSISRSHLVESVMVRQCISAYGSPGSFLQSIDMSSYVDWISSLSSFASLPKRRRSLGARRRKAPNPTFIIRVLVFRRFSAIVARHFCQTAYVDQSSCAGAHNWSGFVERSVLTMLPEDRPRMAHRLTEGRSEACKHLSIGSRRPVRSSAQRGDFAERFTSDIIPHASANGARARRSCWCQDWRVASSCSGRWRAT
jgi:hypothetical protein